MPIENIYESGIIKTNKNKYIKILKINPNNYNLKSDLEKKTILNSYKIFLKTCNFNIQILIQSNKVDLTQNILNIQKNIQEKENSNLEDLSKDYIQFIKKFNTPTKSAIKNKFDFLIFSIYILIDILFKNFKTTKIYY